MGKTKIKTIDDSALVEEKKPKKKVEKVERLKLGASEAKVDAASRLSEPDKRDNASEASDSNVILEGAQRPIESDKKDAIASLQHDKNEAKKSQKPGKAKPRSKKYQEVIKDLDRTKTYPIEAAVDMVKKLSYAKFNATIDISINTAQTGLRGQVFLPYASGKKLTILVFPSTTLPTTSKTELEKEGVIFGDDSTIDQISQGKLDFDLVITTPEWMPKLAKVAKILGPKGLMPNPKNGTIVDPSVDGLKKAIESFQAGKTEYEHGSKILYKTEAKIPIIHLGLGKLDQPTEELSANVKILLQTLGKGRIKKVSLSPTMGPSVKIDLSSI